MAVSTNFLLPEQTISTRLTELFAEGGAPINSVRVLSAESIAGVELGALPTPCVCVVYLGDSSVKSLGAGRAAQIEQTWGVVVAVRNVREYTSGTAARADAGVIITAVLENLLGWSPSAGWSPLNHTRSSHRPGYSNGVWFHPLAFTTTIEVRSRND